MLNGDMLLKDGWCGVYIYPVDNEKLDKEVKDHLCIEDFEGEDFDIVKEDYIDRESNYYLIPKKDIKHIDGLIEFVNSDDLDMEFSVYEYDELELDNNYFEMYMYNDIEDHWGLVDSSMKNLMCLD